MADKQKDIKTGAFAKTAEERAAEAMKNAQRSARIGGAVKKTALGLSKLGSSVAPAIGSALAYPVKAAGNALGEWAANYDYEVANGPIKEPVYTPPAPAPASLNREAWAFEPKTSGPARSDFWSGAPGTGTNAAELGMAPRTPEGQAGMDRTAALVAGFKPRGVPTAGTMAPPGVPTGSPSQASSPTTTTAPLAAPVDKRQEASMKWRETLAITDPEAKRAAQDKLLTDYMDVADPKYLESRGMMGPVNTPGTLGQPMAAGTLRPGTREFNDATRAERVLAQTLGRASRDARRKGNYLGAAGIMSDTMSSGFATRPGTKVAREQNYLERAMARQAGYAETARPYGGFIQKPKEMGGIQQVGTQRNY